MSTSDDRPAPAAPSGDRRRFELSVLADVARALNASVDLPALLAQALEKVAELLGLDTGWVLLFDEATGEPFLAAAQNLPPGLAREPERMTGWCYCLDSFQAGDLSGAANVGVVSCSRLRKLALAHEAAPGEGGTAGLRFHASVPLQVTGDDGLRRLGILNVASPEWRELSADELGLLRTLGDVLSVAIERARLHGRRLEAVQAEERNRLAREIHDTLAQDLSGIAFQLETADALLAGGGDREAARRTVNVALGLARKGLDEARRSVLDLRAAPLEGRTLATALSALAREMEEARGPGREGGPRLEVVMPPLAAGAPERLPPAAEAGLFRIAEEALRNALAHAGAERITVGLAVTAAEVRLTVEDDGRGLEADPGSRGPRRFGLVGMRERAKLLGGALDVESTPGVGTRITARVPLR